MLYSPILPYPPYQGQVEYTLTELGQSLRPVLDALWNWGNNYKEKMSDEGFGVFKRQLYLSLTNAAGETVRKIDAACISTKDRRL